MKKPAFRCLAIALTAAISFSLSGCGGRAEVGSEQSYISDFASGDISSQDIITSSDDTEAVLSSSKSPSKTGSASKTSSKENASSSGGTSGSYFSVAVGKRTSYKIVTALEGEGYDQARLIQKVVRATTGASVPMIIDYEDKKGPEIIIGKTDRLESQRLYSEIGNNEYVIKTESDGDIIIGAESLPGLQKAAELFLETYFDYDENATQVGNQSPIPKNATKKGNLLADYRKHLVWNDEFGGSSLDHSKWDFKMRMREQTAGEDKLYLHDDSDPKAVFVKDGTLTLRAYKQDDHTFISNISLETSGTMIFRHGYLEMRAKVPVVEELCCSLWLGDSPIGRVNPLLGVEIDIFEGFASRKPNMIQFGYHKWYEDKTGEHTCCPNKYIGQYVFKNEQDTRYTWHTFGYLATETSLSVYVDDKLYKCNSLSDENDFGDHHDGLRSYREDFFYLILNNYVRVPENDMGDQIAADKHGYANANSDWPYDYVIDYIRLYQPPGEGDIQLLGR